MTDLSIVDSAGSAGEAALDTVVGGASIALDSLTRPRRTAGRVRRRGSDVNEVISDVTEEVVDEVTALPERMLVAYVRMLRRRARQDDVVGTVSRGVLSAMHRPAKDWARFFQRLERETSLDRRRNTRTRGTVRGTARTAARKTATGARRTAKTARGNAPSRGGRRTTTRRGTTARRRTA
jgi:hypothetical protein